MQDRQALDVEAVLLARQRRYGMLTAVFAINGAQERPEMRVVAERLDENVAASAAGETRCLQRLAVARGMRTGFCRHALDQRDATEQIPVGLGLDDRQPFEILLPVLALRLLALAGVRAGEPEIAVGVAETLDVGLRVPLAGFEQTHIVLQPELPVRAEHPQRIRRESRQGDAPAAELVGCDPERAIRAERRGRELADERLGTGALAETEQYT